MRRVCLKIIRPLITDKNVKPVDELLQLFASKDFLYKFFNDQKFQNDRVVILHSLNSLLEPYSEQFTCERNCATYGCDEQCCVVSGRFSDYCKGHHSRHVKEEMSNPTAKMWLTLADKYQIFSQFLLTRKTVTQHDLAFLRAVDDFRQLDSPSGIQSRAAIVHRVYLKPKASKKVNVDSKIASGIQNQLLSQATCNLFKPAVSQIMERIQNVFESEFLDSKEYNGYWEFMQQTS